MTLLGDREFIGSEWDDYLRLNVNNHILRLKRDYRLSCGSSVGEIFSRLSVGEIKEFNHYGSKIVIQRLLPIKGRRDQCLALLSADGSVDAKDVLSGYRKRWLIERAFFNLETNGFNLADTHLSEPLRIEMMLYILFCCYYLSVISGFLEATGNRIPVKKHGYHAFSLFLCGRRFLCTLMMDMLVSTSRCALNSLNMILRAVCGAFYERMYRKNAPLRGVV